MFEYLRRMLFVTVIFTFVFGLVIYRFYDIQVNQSQRLSSMAIKTRAVKLADNIALRGIVTDRKYREISGGGWYLKENKNGLIPTYRRYGENPLAVHVIGHLSWIGGAAGIEKKYDDYLKSTEKVGIYSEKDIKGRIIPGKGAFLFPNVKNTRNNVVLTIDKDIQQLAEDVCDGKLDKAQRLQSGTMVIMDVDNGDILALVSRPDFNPEQPLTGGKDNLLNKALEFYFPGSVFKILIATAAYEEGLIDINKTYYCDGSIVVNKEATISCSKPEGHGEQSFTESYANSCNPAFITIGEKIYKSGLERYIGLFQLDKQEIIGYSNEKGRINIERGRAALANASIGQNGIQLSPVQIGSLVATIANGGKLVRPRLVKEIRELNGPVIKEFPTEKAKRIIAPATAKKIQYLMQEVTMHGTGTNGWVADGGSAGKTGSAQTGGINKITGKEVINAWFAGYVPLKKPKYAIIVLAEEGGAGNKKAAPLFRLVAEQLLRENYD